MGIISRMRRQNAIYWPPAGVDDYGLPATGQLVELILLPGGGNYRVRWEDKTEEFLDSAGAKVLSTAKVYVPQLPDGSEVLIGGFLWLGDRANLTDEVAPRNNPGAHEIRRYEATPNLKATETLRVVHL